MEEQDKVGLIEAGILVALTIIFLSSPLTIHSILFFFIGCFGSAWMCVRLQEELRKGHSQNTPYLNKMVKLK